MFSVGIGLGWGPPPRDPERGPMPDSHYRCEEREEDGQAEHRGNAGSDEAPHQGVSRGVLGVGAVIAVVHKHGYEHADDAQQKAQDERYQGLGLLRGRPRARGILAIRHRADLRTAFGAVRIVGRQLLAAGLTVHALPISIIDIWRLSRSQYGTRRVTAQRCGLYPR